MYKWEGCISVGDVCVIYVVIYGDGVICINFVFDDEVIVEIDVIFGFYRVLNVEGFLDF